VADAPFSQVSVGLFERCWEVRIYPEKFIVSKDIGSIKKESLF